MLPVAVSICSYKSSITEVGGFNIRGRGPS